MLFCQQNGIQSFCQQIGKKFRAMLELIGKNRTACVLLENGLLSRQFNLQRGRPQGDTPSPITFNIAMQILIFKLELEPTILPLKTHVYPRNKQAVVPLQFKNESNAETEKCECFADDASLFTADDYNSILTVHNILHEFGMLSGLKCNIEKTVIMPIGNPDKNNVEKIRKLGYCIRDNVDLLGINICSKMNNSEGIFNKIHQKLIGISSFWERFKLSLCGRIVIAKTFLLYQLKYVGCFLNPPPPTYTTHNTGPN